MMYNVTIQSPDCVSLIDVNDFFKYLINAIQDLELEIAYMQRDITILSDPDDADQLQLYRQCSYMPNLVKVPVFGEILAFNDISIEEWQEGVKRHLQDLGDCVNGDQVAATDII